MSIIQNIYTMFKAIPVTLFAQIRNYQLKLIHRKRKNSHTSSQDMVKTYLLFSYPFWLKIELYGTKNKTYI
jgi:hypothetical protein